MTNKKKSIKAYVSKKHPSLVLASLNDSLHFLSQEISNKQSWLSLVSAKSQKALRQSSSTELLNSSYLAMLPKLFNKFLYLPKRVLRRQTTFRSKKLVLVNKAGKKNFFVQKRNYSTTSNSNQIKKKQHFLKNTISLNNVLYSNQLTKVTTNHFKKKFF